MFIHGSFASILRGAEFSRPEGHKSDIDIYGTQSELGTLVRVLSGQDEFFKPLKALKTNRTYLIRRDRDIFHRDPRSTKDIEFDVLPEKILELFEALPDNISTIFFGLEAQVISEATDLAIKKATQHINTGARKEKQDRDIEELEAKGVVLGPEHEAVYLALKKLRTEQYGAV